MGRDLANLEPGPYEPCPCGSALKSKFCCRTSQGWLKIPAQLSIRPGATTQAKCYAKSLGGCGPKITREHVISESVLKVMMDHHEPIPEGYSIGMAVEGMPWQKDDEPKVISTNSLATTILCDVHNAALSPLDAEAKRLAETLVEFKRLSEQGSSANGFRLFAGEDIERWLLKIFLGSVAGKILTEPGESSDSAIASVPLFAELVAMLFGLQPVRKPIGLYGLIEHSHILQVARVGHIGTGSLMTRDGMIGVELQLFHAKLGFVTRELTPDGHLFAEVFYRPRCIRFHEHAGVLRHIEFTWKEHGNSAGVFLGPLMKNARGSMHSRR